MRAAYDALPAAVQAKIASLSARLERADKLRAAA
jgi:hypothetical protein